MVVANRDLTLKKSLLVFAVFLISACASSSFFISYPSQMQPHQINVVNGEPQKSFDQLTKKGTGPNHTLDVLESARLAQFAKHYESSKKRFEAAFALFNAEDAKAKLDLSDGGSLLGSFALNDNVLPYSPEAYERIIAYHYQSINYLGEANLQGALVEVRRANEEQVIALDAHQKELAKAEKDASDANVSPDLGSYEDRMHETFVAAAKVKNSFQNAYTFYYSGTIREAAGELNGAYIDYKKALEIYPNNIYVQQDVWRLAKQLNMSSDLELFKGLISQENRQVAQNQNEGEVIIFYEEGFIPAKEEISLPFSTYDKIYSFAFPVYLTPWRDSMPIKIESSNQYLGHSSEIVDMHALAAKSLQEGSFKRLLRQMIRANTKARLQREAANANGDSGNVMLGQFLSGAYTLISERADLRSWLTLPNKVQIARFPLNAGSQTIQFSNATFSSSINVNIEPNRTNLIRIINPGNQSIYVESFTLN